MAIFNIRKYLFSGFNINETFENNIRGETRKT